MKSTMNLRLALSLCLLALMSATACAQSASALYVMKTDGSDVRKVAEPAGFNRVGHPRWSHDGKSIAFSSTRGAQKP